MVTTARPFVEAEPEEVGLSSVRLENLTRVMHRAVDDGRVPGAMTLVGRRGKVAYFDAYGSMDLEAGKPLAEDTIFRIYSMTKPIVSVGLMTLYEEGLFQIDDPVSKYIPVLKDLKVLVGGTADEPVLRDAEREMTIRDVLSHTSGLARGRGNDAIVNQMYTNAHLPHSAGHDGTLESMMDGLSTLPLVFDPGQHWLYSIATNVVGRLIEVLSGQRLGAFLRDRILSPLDMPDTGFEVPESQWSRLAACYAPGPNGGPKLVLDDAPATSHYRHPHDFQSATGGMVSTMHDYARFAHMLANGGELEGARIIGPRTLQFMATNHLADNRDMVSMGHGGYTEVPRAGHGFGLGFAVLMDPVAAGTIGTIGEYAWSGAAGTTFFISPGEDMYVVFMTQLMRAQPLRRELRTTIYSAITD